MKRFSNWPENHTEFLILLVQMLKEKENVLVLKTKGILKLEKNDSKF